MAGSTPFYRELIAEYFPPTRSTGKGVRTADPDVSSKGKARRFTPREGRMMHVPDEHDEGTRALEPPLADDLRDPSMPGPRPCPRPGPWPVPIPARDPGAADDLRFVGPPRIGQVFGGQYVFRAQISGGMGTVWLVRHLEGSMHCRR